MRILYLDCFSGISGDMMIGALADLGITPSTFEWELSKLELGDYHLHFERQTRGGISGVKFDVHGGATHPKPSRTLARLNPTITRIPTLLHAASPRFASYFKPAGCQTSLNCMPRQSSAESEKPRQRFMAWRSKKFSFMKSAHSIRSLMSCSLASASKRSK